MIDDLEQQLSAYEAWLARQPFAANTCRVYLLQVRQYIAYLAAKASLNGNPLHTLCARDDDVRDYKTYLQTEGEVKPASVNVALAALDHFYQFLGLERPRVKREALPQRAPHSLKPEEQQAFLQAVERSPSVRDRAIAQLLFHTGLRLSECAALNVDDVRISTRNTLVVVRADQEDTYRAVHLNTDTCESLKGWLKDRTKRFPMLLEHALFLSLQGKRLSTRAIDQVVYQLGAAAHLELSVRVLRHTCLTNLIRGGNDLEVVARMAGHKRLETTRRYRSPFVED